jgi:hypothetical protein
MADSLLKGKKAVAIAIVALLVVGAVVVLLIKGAGRSRETSQATIDDLISSASERGAAQPEAVVASYENRAFALIATPVAAYYEGGELRRTPLLIAGENPATADDSASTAVTRFLVAYKPSSGVAIGALDPEVESELSISGFDPSTTFTGDHETVSIDVARTFWTSSDGAVIISCREGYDSGLQGATIASYLNIPVIVCEKMTDGIASALSSLGVKYTLVCGPVSGYGKVIRIGGSDDANRILALGMESRDGVLKSVMGDRLGITPTYIALADPKDTEVPSVLDSYDEHFEGTISSTETGSTSDPSLSPDAVVHHMVIPEDYQYARVKVTAVLDFVPSNLPSPFDPTQKRTPEDDGQRAYLYFGFDSDEDGVIQNDADSPFDHLEFMVPTLSYAYEREGGMAVSGVAYTEKPLFSAQGKHAVEMLATLAYDPLDRPQETTYRIDITVEKVDLPNHPLMPYASSAAPYLAACRGGLLLAERSFSIYESEEILNSRFFGDPTVDPTSTDDGDLTLSGLPAMSNNVAKGVKAKVNALIAALLGEGNDTSALASRCGERLETDPMYLGIVSDTNGVPMYYYPAEGQGDLPQEGYGIAGDLFYASIDADPDNPPYDIGSEGLSADIAVGRVDGWDAQDVSALICRSLFYDEIIDSFEGIRGEPWKDSAMNNFGSKVPVGTSVTVNEKVMVAEREAGFTVDSWHWSPLADSRITRDIYQRSNFIYFCAHGFYYWFVPPGYKPTGDGGGYTVANVIEMNFGPSVIFGSSCVTGKIDGIMGYNAISQAFLHSGMNAYVGASRLSWGSMAIVPDMQSGEAFGNYLCLLFYGGLTGYMYDKSGSLISEGGGDLPVGAALAKAKNYFAQNEEWKTGDANADTLEEFNLHGDPAFNPYEPNHQG